MGNFPVFLIWILIVGAIACSSLLKMLGNRKAAKNGEDKERVKKEVDALFGESANHQMIYAHWEEHESYGRTVRITYYRYMVIFQDQTLYIAPLQIDKKTRQIQILRPAVLTLENLGKITVKTKQKNGVIKHMELWLGDKQGHKIIQLHMEAENLRKNRYYPFNLMQEEECAAFERFIASLAQHVAAENPEVDALIKAEQNEGSGMIGAILSIIGAVLGIFYPPLGILLCLIGLILAIISKKKGAKGKKALIISIVCTVWSAVFGWMYWKYFI